MHPVHLHHAVVRILVLRIRLVWPDRPGDARGLRERGARHQRGDRGRVGATFVGVVRQPTLHEQRTEVGVSKTELTVRARVRRDRGRRIVGVPDEDLLGGEHDVDRRSESIDVELAVAVDETQEIERREVAGRVVDAHVLGARIGAVDAARHRRGVPVVDRRIELHPRIAAFPRRLRDLAKERTRFHRLDDRAVDPRGELPIGVRGGVLHEFIGDADGVVGVLELDGLPGVAVQAHVVAHLAERPRLLLFARFAPDELADVRVVSVENHHLRRTTRRPARLDRSRDRVRTAHERDGPRRESPTRKVLFL